MIQKINATGYEIEIGSLLDSSFSEVLNHYISSKKIILVDENTHDHCLEYLITAFNGLEDAEVMLLPCGEENKVMEVCFQVWEAWSEYQIGRRDLVINLGGGIVTDMGGFMASIYKRGLDFIQIPTSLLAMVDASIGGKTGIDMGNYKNQLGVFSNPKHIFIDPGFLKTLPDEEIRNGFSEMIKHGLISSKSHWGKLKNVDLTDFTQISELIVESVNIKNQIVKIDPFEKGERKKLNFGHTFGHAFEGFFLGELTYLPHGHAVAIGMIAESFISWNRALISESKFLEILDLILNYFEVPTIDLNWAEPIFQLMLNDKKNYNEEVKCVLLTDLGQSIIDQNITREDLALVLNFLSNLKK
jgi:3-dehydroquinate synthase